MRNLLCFIVTVIWCRIENNGLSSGFIDSYVATLCIRKSGKFRFSIIIWTWQDLARSSNILAFQMSMKLLQYYDPTIYLLILSYNSIKFLISKAYNITQSCIARSCQVQIIRLNRNFPDFLMARTKKVKLMLMFADRIFSIPKDLHVIWQAWYPMTLLKFPSSYMNPTDI